MFCPKCGSEIGDTGVCPFCDPQPVTTDVAPATSTSESGGVGASYAPGNSLLRTAFSSTLFFVMTILLTANVAFSFIGALISDSFSVEIIALLFVIAMWMIYATAKKDAPLSAGGLKLADGTVTAVFVIGWVIVGLVVFAAICVLIVQMANISFDYDRFFATYGSAFGNTIPYDVASIVSLVMSALGIVLIVAAAVVALVNIFFTRNLKKFVHSIRTSANVSVVDIKKARTVRTWLIVMGVLAALSALSSLFQLANMNALTMLASCCYAATIIIACVWIGQNFLSAPVPVSNSSSSL